MRRYLLAIIVLFIFSPNVNAAVCDYSDKVKFQQLATNITYSYDYNDSNNTFNITFTNVDSSLYLKQIDSNVVFGNAGSEMNISNVLPGSSNKYGVYTTDIYCSNRLLNTIYVSVPYYNPYYNDQLCSDLKDYKYCKKFISKVITYDEFKKSIDDYKKTIKNDDKDNENNNSNKLLNDLLNLYFKYYYIILPSVIVILLIIIIKNSKKDELF